MLRIIKQLNSIAGSDPGGGAKGAEVKLMRCVTYILAKILASFN